MHNRCATRLPIPPSYLILDHDLERVCVQRNLLQVPNAVEKADYDRNAQNESCNGKQKPQPEKVSPMAPPDLANIPGQLSGLAIYHLRRPRIEWRPLFQAHQSARWYNPARSNGGRK